MTILPGTADAVFVPTSRRLFIACSKAGSPPPAGGPVPGIVEMTVDDYKVLNYWKFQVLQTSGSPKSG